MNYFKVNNKLVNSQITAFVKFADMFFPIPILSIYLIGSYIDNSYIETSDIDIMVVVENTDNKDIKKINNFFNEYSKSLFKVEIDLYLVELDKIKVLNVKSLLTREGVINMMLSGKLLFGKDIRNQINKLSLNKYINSTIETPQHFMCKIRGLDQKTKLTSDTITSPNSKDKYSGYMQYGNTKQILVLIGWICSAIVAMESKVYISKKSDVVSIYGSHIGDKWFPYVDKSFNLIREKLFYDLPITPQHKLCLQEICLELSEFEKYYLSKYEEYKNRKKQVC